MQVDDMQVGAVYRCKGGRFRRLTSIVGDRVTYDHGWTPHADRSNQSGSLEWFAQSAQTCVELPSEGDKP